MSLFRFNFIHFKLLSAPKNKFKTYTFDTFYQVDGEPIFIDFEVPSDVHLTLHPDKDSAIEDLYQFGCETGYFPDGAEAKVMVIEKIRKSHFVDLAVNSIPDISDPARRNAMVQWIFLLFKFDDVIDNKDSVFQIKVEGLDLLKKFARLSFQRLALNQIDQSEVASFRKHVGDLIAKQIGDVHFDNEELESINKFFEALEKFHSNLVRIGIDFTIFYEEAANYFQTSVTEVESVETISSQPYIYNRAKSGAVPTAYKLAYALYEVHLPREFEHNHFYDLMYHSSNLEICLVNEGVSAANEEDSPEPNFWKLRRRELASETQESSTVFKHAKDDLKSLHDGFSLRYLLGFENLKYYVEKNHFYHYSVVKMKILESLAEDEKKDQIYKYYREYKNYFDVSRKIFENWMASNLHYSKCTDRYPQAERVVIEND